MVRHLNILSHHVLRSLRHEADLIDSFTWDCLGIAALFYFTLLLRGLRLVISELYGLHRVSRSCLQLRGLDNVFVVSGLPWLD